MTKNKNSISTDEYFNNLYNAPITKGLITQNCNDKCRVCLKDGVVFVYGDENRCDIMEALRIFANIEEQEDDLFPKYLCTICYKFITSAIMFRKIAKKTNTRLKQQTVNKYRLKVDCNDLSKNIKSEPNVSDEEKQNDIINKLCQQEKEERERRNIKIQCQKCNKIIKKSYYKIHMTMHDPEHQKYICDICGKKFRLKVGYYSHRLRHRSDYPYKCQLCPYKCRYSEGFRSHMKTHSGERSFMCTECPARFLFKSNLNTHVLLKHREPQFKCERCQKAFHTELKLQSHNEVDHLGIKRHTCNICGQAFGYRDAMVKHQRRVHKREKLKFYYKPPHKDKNSVN